MNELVESRFIKVMRGAPTHRKFRRHARSIGVSRFEALGVTIALWEWVDAHWPYGDIPGQMTAIDIADSLGIDDIEPSDLLKGWIDAELIDERDDHLSIHGWMDEHRTGASAEFRVWRAQKAAHTRHHKNARDKKPETCQFCQSEATDAMPKDAKATPNDAPMSLSSSLSPKGAESVAQVKIYEPDDPERPFS